MSALDWGLDPRTWAVVPVLVAELSACVPDPSVDVLLDPDGRPLLDVEVCGVVDSAKEATSYQQLELNDGTGLVTVTTFREQQGARLSLPHVLPGDIVLARGRAGRRYRAHAEDPARLQVSGKQVLCWAGEAAARPMDAMRAGTAPAQVKPGADHMTVSFEAVGGRELVGLAEDGDGVLARHWERCVRKEREGRGGGGREWVQRIVAQYGKEKAPSAVGAGGRAHGAQPGSAGWVHGGGAVGASEGLAPSYGVTNEQSSAGSKAGAAYRLEGTGGDVAGSSGSQWGKETGDAPMSRSSLRVSTLPSSSSTPASSSSNPQLPGDVGSTGAHLGRTRGHVGVTGAGTSIAATSAGGEGAVPLVVTQISMEPG